MLASQPRTTTANLAPVVARRVEAISGIGKNGGIALKSSQLHGLSKNMKCKPIRAVISGGDDKKVVDEAEEKKGQLSSLRRGGDLDVRTVITIRKNIKEKITEKVEDQWESLVTSLGRGIMVQLISEEIDPVTGSGKIEESYVRGWLQRPENHPNIIEYAANLTVPRDFGVPGAILITNFLDKEFHLVQIVVHGFKDGHLFFPADTWIHSRKDNPESRIIFRNQVYLPSETPAGIKDLRGEDLLSTRGNGKGERKLHERVYDYDVYNDLGNPDKGEDLARPIVGGKKRPYPRRCRTGRPPMEKDPLSERRIEKPDPVYVPRDEAFEELKQDTFATGRLKAVLHNLIPLIASKLANSDIPFTEFSDIDKLYNDGVPLGKKHDDNQWFVKMMNRLLSVGESLLKYDVPAIIKRKHRLTQKATEAASSSSLTNKTVLSIVNLISIDFIFSASCELSGDRFAWLRDNEFARQALAGVNPVGIELLKEFPILSKLDPAEYGPPESAITKEVIELELSGMRIEQALEEKRLFILDFHDLFLPFVDQINSLPGRKTYASRTILYYSPSGTLKPIVIELTLPPRLSSPRNKRVFTHGHHATTHWIWKLAKAHVCSNDAGAHQVVNHWLRTHACMEPYIIATNRQLSSMHPIFKLLHPHMRYTMEINAVARQNLINGGGVIEACFTPGMYAMELSSAAYESTWRFDLEALPTDLIRRGMAVEDASRPGGVRLVIEDYPYAADGLLIWSAIKELVESYVNHYYSEPNSITYDVELQAWWHEIKNKGHHDKKDEPWWPKLVTKEDLSSILTTMIWIASGQHAAINFGQYPYGGYVPNRPTLMRKLIPEEGTQEYEQFLVDPECTFLTSLPTQLQATKVMAVQDTLSTHSPDEEYLNQLHELHRFSSNDQAVQKLFQEFHTKLENIEATINKRNKDVQLKNRCGAGIPPYELLRPSSGPGVTGRGIPNSVSI